MAQLPKQGLPAGATIGVYEIKETIRKDRFGITYKAWNEHLSTIVTLKEYFPEDLVFRGEQNEVMVLKPDTDDHHFEFGLSAFIKQGQTLADIQHPNINTVHNVVEFNNTAYLATDVEQGTPLSSKKLKNIDSEGLLLSILDALQTIHACGTVHGDINPDAILIKPDGSPVLIDFAAARLSLAARTGNLSEHLRSGYSAPELYEAKTVVGDIYALGATLYYFITHTQPKPSTRRLEAKLKNGHDPLPSIYSLAGPAANKILLKTINLMLTPEMKQRPQTVAEVLKALIPEETPHQGAVKKHQTSPAEQQPSQQTLVIVAALLLLLGLIGWFILSGSEKPAALDQTENNEISQDKPTIQIETVAEAELNKQPVVEEQAIQAVTEQLRFEEEQEQPEDTPDTMQLSSNQVITEVIPAPVGVSEKSTDLAKEQTANTTESQLHPENAENSASVTETAEKPVDSSVDTETEIPSSKEIDVLIAEASNNIESFQLTTPEQKNAYDQLQAVLAIDPNNQQAQQGIQQIVDKYVWLIDKTITDNELDYAKVYLNRVRKIAPDDPRLKELTQKLKAQQNQFDNLETESELKQP